MQSDKTAIHELIYRSCLTLDAKNFTAYLALCDESFRYTITAHSPEIRKDMIWFDHDKPGLQSLFTNLPRHNSDHSPITRHAIVYTVSVDASPRFGVTTGARELPIRAACPHQRCTHFPNELVGIFDHADTALAVEFRVNAEKLVEAAAQIMKGVRAIFFLAM